MQTKQRFTIVTHRGQTLFFKTKSVFAAAVRHAVLTLEQTGKPLEVSFFTKKHKFAEVVISFDYLDLSKWTKHSFFVECEKALKGKDQFKTSPKRKLLMCFGNQHYLFSSRTKWVNFANACSRGAVPTQVIKQFAEEIKTNGLTNEETESALKGWKWTKEELIVVQHAIPKTPTAKVYADWDTWGIEEFNLQYRLLTGFDEDWIEKLSKADRIAKYGDKTISDLIAESNEQKEKTRKKEENKQTKQANQTTSKNQPQPVKNK